MASAQCRVSKHHASLKSRSPPLAPRHLTASSSGARLISFSDVIEVKGAAAAAATKEKETKDAELAQLQARECSRSAAHAHAHAPPHVTSSSSQATFGTIPSNGSRIKMPSPVASLMSLSGTEGAVKKLFDGDAPLAARDFFFLLPLSGPAPSSRVAAAKRVGGGFDKSECALCRRRCDR